MRPIRRPTTVKPRPPTSTLPPLAMHTPTALVRGDKAASAALTSTYWVSELPDLQMREAEKMPRMSAGRPGKSERLVAWRGSALPEKRKENAA